MIRFTTKNSIQDLAYIPHDPAMDLLRTNPNFNLLVLYNLSDNLQVLKQERQMFLAKRAGFSKKLFLVLKHFLLNFKTDLNENEFLLACENHLKLIFQKYTNPLNSHKSETNSALETVKAINIISDNEKKGFISFFHILKQDNLFNNICTLIEQIEEYKLEIEKSKRPYSAGPQQDSHNWINKKVIEVLIKLNKLCFQFNNSFKNTARLLLFNFTLFKLFQTKNIPQFIQSFVPMKKNRKGNLTRDRFQQIKNIVVGDINYQKSYFELLKKFTPIILKQLISVIKTFKLNNLIYLTKENTINKKTYLKLSSNYLHEIIHSGLSIILGFKYRTASIAFTQAAEKLKEKLYNQK